MEQEKIILLKYEPLIYKVAKNFYNVELCDLYQAGSLGLIKAYRNYNENVGKNFINFAYMYIYGEMFEFVNNSQTIKLNKEYLRLSKSIKKAITMLQEELGRTPTTTELSTFLEIDEETIINILNITKESVSLDDKITDDGAYYIDTIGKTLDLDSQILINDSLETLSDLERKVVLSRYFEDLTQSETASLLGISQVKVSRIEKKGKAKIKEYIKS